MISNEGKASFNRCFFVYRYNFIRVDEVRELRSHARANARDASFPGRASECDRACRLDGYNLDPWEFVTKSLRDPGEGTRGAGPHKNPIDLVELARDLMRRLLGMNIFVGYVGILIEPDRVRVRLQDLIYFLQSASQESPSGIAIFNDYDLCPIELHPSHIGAI